MSSVHVDDDDIPLADIKEAGRKRRAPGEVERLIIDAALEVFAAKGYAGATTREIAAVAKVHEPMVYRRFGSKAKLFEATVLAPFNELISTYLDTYQPRPDPSDSLETLARRFIEPFYDLVRERQDLLLALLAASQFHDDFAGEEAVPLTGLAHLIEAMERQTAIEFATRPLPGVDAPAALRAAIGMVMGVAILGDWFESDEHRVGREALLDEMVRLCIYGVNRPVPGVVPADDADTHVNGSEVGELLDRVAEAERRAIRAELELDLLRSRRTRDHADA
ncbi:MAG: TetR/AcrR family transcriptional regulator [Solirubrobacteraceae bacterium]